MKEVEARTAQSALDELREGDGLALFALGSRNMERLQESEAAPVIRTDFSDDSAWEAVCAALRLPDEEFGLVADVVYVRDPRYDGLTVEQLAVLAPQGPP